MNSPIFENNKHKVVSEDMFYITFVFAQDIKNIQRKIVNIF